MAKTEFTEDDVRGIREGWDKGTLVVRDAADFFGVSHETIRRICRRETHRGVKGPRAVVEDGRVARGTAYREREAGVGKAAEESLARMLGMLGAPVEECLATKALWEFNARGVGKNPMEDVG